MSDGICVTDIDGVAVKDPAGSRTPLLSSMLMASLPA